MDEIILIVESQTTEITIEIEQGIPGMSAYVYAVLYGGYTGSEEQFGIDLATVTGISAEDISNWNDAFSWGDHSTFGYALLTDLANYEPLIDKNTGFNLDLGTTSGTVAEGNHKHYQLHEPDGTNPFVYTDASGQLHIDGNIIQNGSAYETHAEQVYTKDDYIILRDEATAGLSNGSYAGLKAKKYDGVNDGHFVFDNQGWARVGDVGQEQPLATRIETPTNLYLAYWDDSNKRLDFLTRETFVDASGDTMTGALTLPMAVFGTYSATGSEATGSTYYDTVNHTLATVLENGVTLQHGQEIHIYGKNTSGAIIPNGAPVAIVSNNGQFTAFGVVDITTAAAYAFAGIATQEIGINAFGYVTKIGVVHELDTSLFDEGKPVYVSATGTLTKTYPTVPNYVINVGIVEYKHAQHGRINVISQIVPRMQDLSDVNGTPLATSGQIAVWNQTTGYFDYTANINNFLTSVTAHNLLSTTHGDTTAASVVRGDLITGQGATPKWTRLALGTTGKVLTSDGTDLVWSTNALGSAAYANTTAFEVPLSFSNGLTRTINEVKNDLITGLTGGQTVIGGTGITDILKLKGTTGNGTATSPAIQFLVGNNGGTVAGTVLNNAYHGFLTASPTQIISLGGTAARTIWMERNTTAATAGQGLTLSSGGAYATGTNLAGGDLLLKSGISTGTGDSAIRFFTATAGSTGSADNTPTEKVTILGNGYTGFGINNPLAIIHTYTTGNPNIRLETNKSTETWNTIQFKTGIYDGQANRNRAIFEFGLYQVGSSSNTLDGIYIGRSGGVSQNDFIVNRDGNTGLKAVTFTELLTLGTAGTTAGTLSLAGATSGKAILQVSAAAGTPTLTLPTVTGTLATTADVNSWKFGDQTTNYTTFEADGTMKMTGTATVFDDLTSDITRAKTAGSHVVFNDTEDTMDFANNSVLTDWIVMNFQMSHKWKSGSDVFPHIHFEQTSANVPNFLIQYRWQKNLGTKTTAWTNYKANTNVAVTYTSGTINQICYGAAITPPVGYSISDIIQLRVIRDTANTSGVFAGADPYTGTVSVTSCDMHYEMDTLGSRQEYIK